MSSLREPPAPEWPKQLGCYDVLEPVTRRAALARDVFGRPVWLHWSPCDGDAGAPCGAEREYQALCVNPAQHVPEPLDLLRTEGRCYSVTEVINGVSLARMVAEGRGVDIERVASCLLAALHRAHSAGWVHGDVKPANVMIRPDGAAVLVDWELASRVGETVPPGSLGYAPPHAWEGGYRAETRNDTYALAVLIAELQRGEPLFRGDRAGVIARQRSFDFASVGGCGKTARCVLEAASRGVGCEASDVAFGEALLALRTDHAIRASMRGVASSLVAALRRGASADAETLAFDDQLPQLVRAVAERWRLSERENAVTVRESEISLEARPPDSGSARLDELRSRVTQVARELARRLLGLQGGVVFVDGADVSRSLAPFIRQFEEQLRSAGLDTTWKVSIVHSRDPALATRGSRRGGVREALQMALATTHVSGAICEAIVRSECSTLGRAIAAVAQTALAGGLVGSRGHVELAQASSSGGGWLDCLERRLAPDRSPEVVAASEQYSTADLLLRAERLLLRADLLAAYPTLVRLTTDLLGSPAPESDELLVVRAADLWLEFGNLNAAEALLGGLRTRSIAVCRRRARIAASRGDTTELLAAISELKQAGCPVGDLELARFEAIAIESPRDGDRAYYRLKRVIRQAPRDGRRIDFVEALAGLAGAARTRGRAHTAARLLRLARNLADELGAVRVALRIDANLLGVRSRADGGAVLAQAWADLGARCRRWGLNGEARRHLVRSATLSLQAEDLEQAERALADAEAAAHAGGTVNALWSSMERYIDSQIRARRDLPLDWAPQPARTVAEPLSWWTWLASRLAAASLKESVTLSSAVLARETRADPVRLARVVVRWVSRGGDSSARLARALGRIEAAFSTHAPLVGGLARLATRGAPDEWPIVGLLPVLRDALEESEGTRELALAFHATAFVWSDYSDTTAAAWLRSHAPEIDEARPYGVFAWEWRLAMLRADTILGQEPDVDTRLEGVLDALEAWATNLPPHKREAYLGVVPFERIAATAGFAGPDHLKIPHGGEMLVAFRAHLRREAVRFRGSRGRAAGLERVLHSALRLRSGMSIDEVLREVVSGVLSVCRAERAVVVFDGPSGERRAKLATLERMEDVRDSDAEVSQSAIDHARREGRACIFDDACGSAEFGDSPSVRLYRPRSLMIAPLQAHGETLGYVYVENRSLPKSFSASDLQLLEGFAAQAGLAIDNARLVEELRDSLEELKRVRTEAVRAESLRVLGQMAGEVAHDFNNLLAVILGETQLLLQDRPDAGMERSLEVIERAAMDGAAAIRRIQSSTRVRPREEFTVLDLGVLAREVLDFTRVRWTSASADPSRAIRTRCRSAQGVFVSGLGPELREVFTNLVLNAVDAMPEGGDLLVSVRAVEGVAEVEVRDSGCGIPENIRERVFDPFFSTKGEKGNGLGLAIAKEIVERHGGTISVSSTPGSGTGLCVRLPAVERPEDETQEELRPACGRGRVSRGASRRVLVVDDEEGVLRVLVAMLRAEGFDVTAAGSGVEATRRLEAGERYDVLITDLYMPGVSGVEVIETTRRTGAARRVVVMSGYGDVVGEGRLARHSVDRVLPKPFTLSDVREAVE